MAKINHKNGTLDQLNLASQKAYEFIGNIFKNEYIKSSESKKILVYPAGRGQILNFLTKFSEQRDQFILLDPRRDFLHILHSKKMNHPEFFIKKWKLNELEILNESLDYIILLNIFTKEYVNNVQLLKKYLKREGKIIQAIVNPEPILNLEPWFRIKKETMIWDEIKNFTLEPRLSTEFFNQFIDDTDAIKEIQTQILKTEGRISLHGHTLVKL